VSSSSSPPPPTPPAPPPPPPPPPPAAISNLLPGHYGVALYFHQLWMHIAYRHFLYPQKAYNSLVFQAWPVCQVGHHAELPQLCSCCAHASNHTNVNTRAAIRIH
jgi:hypothetical protein